MIALEGQASLGKTSFLAHHAGFSDMLIHRLDSNKLRTMEGVDMDDLEEQISLYEAIIGELRVLDYRA